MTLLGCTYQYSYCKGVTPPGYKYTSLLQFPDVSAYKMAADNDKVYFCKNLPEGQNFVTGNILMLLVLNRLKSLESVVSLDCLLDKGCNIYIIYNIKFT